MQRYEYQHQETATECPWVDGDLRFVKCIGGKCQQPQPIEEELQNGIYASALFDDNPRTNVTLAYGTPQIVLKYSNPLDLEEIHIYGESYNACLKVEFLATESRTLGPIYLGCNGSQKSDNTPAWSASGLALHGVKHIVIKVAQQKPIEEADSINVESTYSLRQESWNAKLGEIKLRAFPLLPCGSGGFLGGTDDCEVFPKPASSLDALHCKGEWSEWSVCDTSCTRISIGGIKRSENVLQLRLFGTCA